MSTNQQTIEVELLIADLITMNESSRGMGEIFKGADNVHNHTAALGAHCRNVFLVIDTRHTVSASVPAQPLAAVIAEITAYTSKHHPEMLLAVQEALNSVHAAAGCEEAETKLEVSDLLMRTWALTKHPLAPVNAADLVIDNLQHNKATGGGCLAGISARLTQPYTEFVRFILATTLEQKQEAEMRAPMLPRFERHRQQDDDLQLALAISASMQHAARAEPTGEKLDPDLAEAIRRSLQ